jgi:hypothetical protein
MFMLMPPHFVNGLFYVFRPDIGCIASGFLICCERNHDMAYKDLIMKIEKRFGFRELPETAQVQFSNARQTLEDWADRVLSLATRAFRELQEKHMYQQV